LNPLGQAELEHLVLAGEQVAVAPIGAGVLDDPLVEVARADRQAVVLSSAGTRIAVLPP
jgi:hypothetical protein